ncbi:hypothetical protein GCM10028806_33440 [Spirosoma terrae]|uniref:Uncharacterized protein n=1 Tax=Spirosoma terrae TaxID=1968276 RepID=A0A6L9LG70_9BACT|nr:hypothetical protein [Spirosoma terrae]NDU95659.1 hypothetical protein [Spirosoma terrae]
MEPRPKPESDFLPALPVLPILEGIEPKSKEEIQSWAMERVTELLAWQNTFKVLDSLTRLKEILTVMEPIVREAASTEMAGKRDAFYGITLEKRNGAVQYDFSTDPTWVQLDKAKKDLEKYLKKLTGPAQETDPETGEVTTFYPPAKTYGKDSLAVSLK